MDLLSRIVSLGLQTSVPPWAFWLIALLVVGHAVWVGLSYLFGVKWPGLVTTLICIVIVCLGFVFLWNQVPLDQVVSSQPELTWLSIGSPAELRIAINFHAGRLCSGALLWLLPMAGLTLLGQLAAPSLSPSSEKTGVWGVLSAICLANLFLLAFAGDAWILLAVWMSMPPLCLALLLMEGVRPNHRVRSRELMKFLIPMLMTDLGLLLGIMVIGSGLSTTKLSATLHRETLLALFAENPAALDVAVFGFWIAIAGRLLLPFLSLGNELWRGCSAKSLLWYHLFFGAGPATLLLLKFHDLMWTSSLSDTLLLLTTILGAISAFFAICSGEDNVSIGWAVTWATSTAIAGMLTGTRVGLVAGLLILSGWMTLLAVYSLCPRGEGGTGSLISGIVLSFLSLGLFGRVSLVDEFSRGNQVMAACGVSLGAALTLFAWSCILWRTKSTPPLASSVPMPSRTMAIQVLFVIWGLGLGVLLCECAWWASSEGLMLLTASSGLSNFVGSYSLVRLTPNLGLVSLLLGIAGAASGVLWGRTDENSSWKQWFKQSSLGELGRRELYTADAYFFVSLITRGAAQLTRMFDWIVTGFVCNRIPQKLIGVIQQELGVLTSHTESWVIMTWTFAVTLVLVIFLGSN